ncbi:MAG: 4-(cytidine 5'-diphospho)-2-C-methyl-D-erythritol kinase [Clostridia bacterium]|nr:4-(cytidine 5'-diphospho)-2-C-methyl-D-erythritol kinase [Clostridia bacterium]
MVRTVYESAYAKINLTLDITGKRNDGYHTLDSIMQTVTLADEITLTYNSERDNVSLACDDTMLSGADNLCCKAAQAYLDATGIRGGIEITLAKKIPVAAGLGGGSADAAAVLRALMRIFPGRMTKDALLVVAAKLGADVPFCFVGGCMRAQGIGEMMVELPQIFPLPIVIARRGEGISSAEAYRLYDANPAETFFTGAAVEAMMKDDHKAFLSTISNGFEKAIFPVRPEAERVCSELIGLGALTAHMSGSGSAVFGIFASEECAMQAAEALRKHEMFAEVCYPCSIESA